jgi:hypothetical protein
MANLQDPSVIMTQQAGLGRIARGDASPEQARAILLFIFGQPTPDLLQDAATG